MTKGIEMTVGNTPLCRAERFEKAAGLKAEIYLKLEYFNPAGSVKDRTALYIIREAEKSGKLEKGGKIVEATSGNTGIGLAALSAAMGYKCVIVMPENMSEERKKLIRAYGAELVLTDSALGMKGAIERADEIVSSEKNAVLAGQFVNPANARAHYETTGEEIWRDMKGNLTAFVSAVGTGGTITGTGKKLKERDSGIRIIAAEPAESPVLSGGKAGPHKLQGIGAGFVPEIYDPNVVDLVERVSYEEAVGALKILAKSEGFLVGISSGAALSAAMKYALIEQREPKKIVVLLPDGGDRYLSTDLFD